MKATVSFGASNIEIRLTGDASNAHIIGMSLSWWILIIYRHRLALQLEKRAPHVSCNAWQQV